MKTFYTERSNRISSMEYNPMDGTLLIDFTRGGTYRYYEVPEEVYDSLVMAQSIGRAFDNLVKGKYRTVKVK